MTGDFVVIIVTGMGDDEAADACAWRRIQTEEEGIQYDEIST
jgi:hypothetical protein